MRYLMPALSALLLAMLVACESSYSGDVPGVALEAPRRCGHCGWIESKREIEPGPENPRAAVVYEYTVRMPDGSGSVFRAEPPSSWREGQRLVLIKGATD